MGRVVTCVVLVVVLGVMSSPCMAEMQIGFNAVGPKLGFIMPEDPIESTFGFGVASDLGAITPVIHLGAFMEYWRKSYDHVDAESSWRDLAIGVSGKYRIPMEGTFKPYAGGGLGFHLHKWESKAKKPVPGHSGEYSDSDMDLGIHLLGGADYSIGPKMKAVGELRYTLADPDYFAIWLGILYALHPMSSGEE